MLGLGNGYWSGDQPAAKVSWYQAAAFVNWLNTSTGHQAAYNLTYSGGAYTQALWQSGDSGYDASNPFRNSLALFVLPSENEWYKAAYYNPANSSYNLYPTGNSEPTAVASGTVANTAVFSGNDVNPRQPASVTQAGGLSPYGTMGQGGNIHQWEESAFTAANTDPAVGRVIRGGSWGDISYFLQSSYPYYFAPSLQSSAIGFRVAEVGAVPEKRGQALPIDMSNFLTSFLMSGRPTAAEQYRQKRGQALPIDMFNFLTSFLMSGRPTAAEQYRQTRLGSPM